MIQYSSHLFLCLLLGFSVSLEAQNFDPIDIPLSQNGRQLKMPWVGGLNAPQLSQIDLNGDGFMDLHIFDRQGNIQLTFLHSGIAGQAAYEYAPAYLDAFPEVTNWMMIRDYNGDGIEDIMAFSDIPGIDGMIAYTGSRQNESLSFSRFQFGPPFNMASFPSNNGNQLPLYISKIDYPAIDDVDCDGDLDILTFNISGGYIEWYRNTSVEQRYGLDSLQFVLEDNCWGGFYESGISMEVDLAQTPGDCYKPGQEGIAVNYRHTGSTLMLFDPDEDGDQDLVLGDLSFNNLNHLTNGGDCDQAWMNAQNTAFPSTEKPVDLPTFPVSFYLDIDQDGQKDILAAPNYLQEAEDRDVIWWYKGDRDAAEPFAFQQKDFLVEDMLDLGTSAFPAFFDYDNDGLLDLVVGNQFQYKEGGLVDSRLFLFKNIGTATAPAYELVDDNYLNMQRYNPTSYGFRPAFGDLDSDGDTDIIIGEAFGYLYFGENLAGPNQVPQFAPLEFKYMNIDVGISSYPCIADVDQDGLMDLLVGERDGNFNFFENIGSPGNPQFLADVNAGGNINRLSNLSTRAPGFLVGNSSPTVFYQDDHAYLITGGEQGNILLYQSENKRLDGTLTKIDDQVAGFRAGESTALALGDMDDDGFLELVVGNARGGLQIRNTTFQSGIAVATRNAQEPNFQLELFPNPSINEVQIKLSEVPKDAVLEISELSGRIIHSQKLQNKQTTLLVKEWPAGIYILRVQNQNGSTIKKLIKN